MVFKGSFVGMVEATDPDPMGSDNSNIQFSLAASPSEQGFFTINATSVRKTSTSSLAVVVSLSYILHFTCVAIKFPGSDNHNSAA